MSLSPLLKALRPALWTALAFSVFTNLMLLGPTLYTIQVFDRVLSSRSVPTLWMLTAGVALALAAMSLVDLARSRLLVVTGRRFDQALAEPVLIRAVREGGDSRQPLSAEGLRDVSAVRGFMAGPGMIALFDLPWMAIYGLVIWLFHPALGAVALLGSAALLGLAVAVERMNRNAATAQGAAQRDASTLLSEGLRHADALRALGMTARFARRWADANQTLLAVLQAGGSRVAALLAASKFLRQAIQVAMMGLGAWLVLDNRVSPGVMIAATILFGRAMAPVEALIGHWSALQAARSAWGRLRIQVFQDSHVALTTLPAPLGRLGVQGVALAGPKPDLPILRPLSFELPAGRALGLVGPSGAGKSSLARVISGAWRPDAGTVSLDGADLWHYGGEARGRWVGYLPQEAGLLPATVAENIARFEPGRDADVIDAARRAGVHELIAALPQGYDTRLGDGGWRPSAGQAQRLALARALFGSPRLVVLDEPNAHLDAEGEQALLRTLADLRSQGVTVVMVTHKLALMSALDDLLVLREGRMELFGPREAVLARLSGTAPPPQVGAAS